FLEIDWLGVPGGHVHMPKLDALSQVAAAFAPHGISIHFDVGNNFQQPANSAFIVPGQYAQGGEFIDESAPYLQCPNAKTNVCAFPNLGYPALGWKIGFKGIKD